MRKSKIRRVGRLGGTGLEGPRLNIWDGAELAATVLDDAPIGRYQYEDRNSPKDEQLITHPCGASSSKVPDYAQIPREALIRLARRFELGAAKHGRKNYRRGLTDRSYVIERANHVIDHALKLIAKLEGELPDDGDDDAGAVIWGGAFLCEATKVLKDTKKAS